MKQERDTAVFAEAAETTVCYRLEYARKHPAIWIAHLDVMRTFERASLRAKLPLKWSGGFNPRPAFEFALPISVGLACCRDPFEIVLTERLAAADVQDRLGACLPDGFDLVSCRVVEQTKTSLMAAVGRARYRLEAAGLEAAESLLSSDRPLTVTRHGKRGERTVDLRELLLAFETAPGRLDFTALAGSRANLRADLLLRALVDAEAVSADLLHKTMLTRLEVMLDWDD